MKWRAVAVSLGSILAVLAGSHILGESPVDFERDVQPILQEKCLSCHTPDAAQSGLVMESVEAMLEGGEKAGPSILAGDSAGSPLVRHLRGELEPQMPVGGDPLPEAQIALIAAWIDQMAPAAAPDGAAQTAGQSASPHDFETDIKPLLEQNCLACHSSQTHQSGLVVETETALLKGGAIQGAAILAGNSQESPLIQRLRGTRAPRMPMNGQPLAEEQIQRIARWIDQLDPARAAEIAEHAKTPGWPWTPVTQPQVPAVKHKEWVRNPIDAFVLAKLEERRLDPAPAVSPRGLLRRLYFSLIGLPPTPEAMKRFLADPSPEAYRLEVEKLLADSRYGEHWGRHWLDLARYSDTRGGAIDDPQTHLWRYRDYVIRAFNQDRPYDRFIKEQLAGDVFRAYGDEGKLGLGFLGLWVKVEANGQQGRRNYITDVVNTTGSVFMGLTLGCAQCHDHKYDPLPQQDYFRIEAFFSPVNFQKQDLAFHQYEMPLQDPERWETRKKAWKEHLEKIKKNAEAFSKELSQREIEHQLLVAPQDLKDWAHGEQKKIPFPKDTLRSAEEKERSRKISLMTGRFANPNVDGYYDPKAYVVRDSPLQHNIATYVLTGGNWRLRADQVKPGFLSAVTGNSDPVNMDGLVGSRRQLLAKWIARREHPLTARVMVNRIWQYHFGNGLVATSSDFGSNGSGTAHQDLIDWLAWEFMESGWSVKEIHRLILNSNVYGLSMAHPRSEEYEKVDPNNRYLWVRDPVRIPAESLRDTILAVSGQLNPSMGGPPFFPEENLEQMARAGTWWIPSSPEEVNRRTVYTIQSRSYPIPLIKVFDGPNLDESCVDRGNTTVTPQVFSLFNGKFPHRQSRAMAERILAEVGPDPLKQVVRAFQLAFQRDPSPQEKTRSLAFLGGAGPAPEPRERLSLKQVALVQGPEPETDGKGPGETGSLTDLCLILINMNEFVYLE